VLLDDPKIETRQAAARALQAAGHPGAIPYLMEALRDPFWWYERDGAVQDLLSAIESMGEAVVDPLVEALSDKEGTVRRLAATILGNLKSPRAMDHLGTLVYDLHHDVSRAAAIALGKYGLPAFELLMDSLRHAESGIREHAVLGLGYIRSEPVASLLVACLSDPERGVRRQAVLSMAELKDPRTLPALHEIAASRTDRELAALAKETIARIQAAGNQPIPR
jgi:HEAT repeat protein